MLIFNKSKQAGQKVRVIAKFFQRTGNPGTHMGRRDLIEGGDVCNAHSLDLQRQRFDAKSGNALIVLFAGFQQIKGLQTRKMGVKMVVWLVYLFSICSQFALFSDDQPADVPSLATDFAAVGEDSVFHNLFGVG